VDLPFVEKMMGILGPTLPMPANTPGNMALREYEPSLSPNNPRIRHDFQVGEGIGGVPLDSHTDGRTIAIRNLPLCSKDCHNRTQMVGQGSRRRD